MYIDVDSKSQQINQLEMIQIYNRLLCHLIYSQAKEAKPPAVSFASLCFWLNKPSMSIVKKTPHPSQKGGMVSYEPGLPKSLEVSQQLESKPPFDLFLDQPLLGPLFVYQSKSFEVYNFFAYTLTQNPWI